MNHNGYRHLSTLEIEALSDQGCFCQDWTKIYVSSKGFNPSRVHRVIFQGECFIGHNEGSLDVDGDISLPSMIADATLIECKVGDNCRIMHIGQYIYNYSIGANTRIEDVSLLCFEKNATCGEGAKASVLVETGGRDIILHKGLTAQIAYLGAFLRRDKVFQSYLNRQIEKEIDASKSTQGFIGESVELIHSGVLRNLKIYDGAYIAGVRNASDVTLASSKDSPIMIYSAECIEETIIAEGAVVKGANLIRSFIGEVVRLAYSVTVHDSLIFSNSVLENGEVCASFIAPHTVSMHKSTLLIGGFFSFANLGSGSNQSNHLYKLGPTQQGILERGCKLSSDSYILWPAHVGAYSFIKGRHYNHPDSCDFPFSYLIEEGGQTILLPGRAFGTSGFYRDIQKWPNRDGRKGLRRDIIDYGELDSCSIEALVRGYLLLQTHMDKSQGCCKDYEGQGFVIPSKSIPKSIELYKKILHLYIGRIMTKSLYLNLSSSKSNCQFYDWIDVAGAFFRKEQLLNLLATAVDADFDYCKLIKEIADLHHKSSDIQLPVVDIFAVLYGFKDNRTSLTKIIEDAKEAERYFSNLRIKDAAKEYGNTIKVGYAPFFEEKENQNEFEAIRGEFEGQQIVKDIQDQLSRRLANLEDASNH